VRSMLFMVDSRAESMSIRLLYGIGIAVLAFVLGFWVGKGSEVQAAEGSHVFELRTYAANPGKLPEVVARFRNDTEKLFKKHGMKSIGYWTPQDEPHSKDMLIYMLSFESRQKAQDLWAQFQNDPEWKKVRADSEMNGPLVDKVESVFMEPTDFSAMK